MDSSKALRRGLAAASVASASLFITGMGMEIRRDAAIAKMQGEAPAFAQLRKEEAAVDGAIAQLNRQLQAMNTRKDKIFESKVALGDQLAEKEHGVYWSVAGLTGSVFFGLGYIYLRGRREDEQAGNTTEYAVEELVGK